MKEAHSLSIEHIINGPKYFYRNVSVDCVILGYHEKELKVLLLRAENSPQWTLASGYIYKTETADNAARRMVCERTRLEQLSLHQFRNYSNPDRIQLGKNPVKKLLESNIQVKLSDDFWMFENFITLAYFALTEFTLVQPTGTSSSEDCQWWDINNLPDMTYDHAEIVRDALKALRIHMCHQPIGYDLLPEKFTLPDLHALYETILKRPIDIRNFQKKMTNIGLIEKLKEQKKVSGHRRPYLYIFNKERYDQMIKEEEVLVF